MKTLGMHFLQVIKILPWTEAKFQENEEKTIWMIIEKKTLGIHRFIISDMS